MLEDDYSQCLTRLLETSDHALVIPRGLKESLAKRGATPTAPNDVRKFVRYYFNGLGILELNETFPSIAREHAVAKVVTRNISRGGISFLHSEQLFPGERVTLWLPAGKHDYVVVRCIAHHPRCYEIGAQSVNQQRVPVRLEQLGAPS